MRPTRDTWWLLAVWTTIGAICLLFWAVVAFIAWNIFR